MKSKAILSLLSVAILFTVIATTLLTQQQAHGAAFVSRCNADLTDCRTTTSDDKSLTNARAQNGVILVDGQPPTVIHQKINSP